MRLFDKAISPNSKIYMALEEIVTGRRRADKEYTFYGRLVDPSQLEQATSKEEQEQWSVNVAKVPENGAAGQIRVRQTIKDGGEPEYTQVVKKKGVDEDVGVPITKDFFEAIKELSDFGMVKTRFIIPIEGSPNEWHIDLYPKPDGSGFYDWVKVDLELESFADDLPTMPVRLEEMISNQYGDRTDAEVARIEALMKNEFKAVNPYSAGGAADPQTTLNGSEPGAGADATPPAPGTDVDDGGKQANDNDDASKTGGGDSGDNGQPEGGQNADENKDDKATGDAGTGSDDDQTGKGTEDDQKGGEDNTGGEPAAGTEDQTNDDNQPT